MPLVEWIFVLGGVIVLVAMIVVLRVNRHDEKDVWKPPEDFGDPVDHGPAG